MRLLPKYHVKFQEERLANYCRVFAGSHYYGLFLALGIRP